MDPNRWNNALRLVAMLTFTAALMTLGACSSGESSGQSATVVPDRLALRSSTAKVARAVAELHSGDRVTVLERLEDGGTSWAKLRAPNGQTGWVEASYLVNQDVIDRSRRIADEVKQIQAQAVGRSKARLKLRLTPERSADDNVATMLPAGTPLEIIDRERRPRPAAPDAKGATQPAANAKEGDESGGTKYDEWYKVRLKDNALLPAGWIYAGSVELEIPPEISYYVSSGRRIIGWQKLGSAQDDRGRSGDHYLVLERWTSSSDDKHDFDRMQVLAYAPAARDYGVPFREDLHGRFPVVVKMEGNHGTFQVTAIDKNDQAQTLNYSVDLQEDGRVSVKRLTPKEPTHGKRKR